jgi:signal transduction histidine kinase
VILNLLTNAFYIVSEKKKKIQESPKNGHHFEPTVTISTRLLKAQGNGSSRVEIKVRDNGLGVPKNVAEKIFQPFFTTKPAGEGTGLGLSLSYDIIKSHGGELTLKSDEGEGSEFTISLPA